jgi:regulation of enolase protein 1 (concanavalin A-like superfamily)
VVQEYRGVASGTFVAPDHEYPSFLTLRLTATDAAGLAATTVRRLDPQTVALTFDTSPSGLQLVLASDVVQAPVTRTFIVGSAMTISAPSPQSRSGSRYTFSSWSDGGAQTHTIRAGTTATSYRATFAASTAGLPSGWTSRDIGAVGVTGSGTFANGVFSVSGGGADVWGSVDAFHYVYRSLTGDGTIVARVASVQGSQPWAKLGIMMRGAIDPSAAHAFMVVSAGRGLAFQRRPGNGALTATTPAGDGTAPRWVRLTRVKHVLTASTSTDGRSWTVVGSDTVAMPSTIFVGLAASSHDAGALASATFDNVTVTAGASPEPAPLPTGWSSRDIGTVGLAGSASHASGVFTLRGAGADVWGNADAFHYAYRSLAGDGSIVARVAGVNGTAAWTKMGVMIRSTTAAGSSHAFMLVSSSKGVAFQRRTADGGLTTHTSGGAGTAPRWVRLARAGQVITASVSLDGKSWTVVGQDRFSMPTTVLVGLAASSHSTTALATGTFDSVAVTTPSTLPAGWTARDIGTIGVAGGAAHNNGVFTIRGAGADVWGTADGFHYAYRPMVGDGSIVARVASVIGSEPWTKVGVMIRGTTAAGSAHAFMIVSAGKGLAFQRRRVDGGISTHTAAGTGTAPRWVRLVRSGQTITASVSNDGVAWTVVGSDTFTMPGTVHVGLATSSHTTGALATGTFDRVTVVE